MEAKFNKTKREVTVTFAKEWKPTNVEVYPPRKAALQNLVNGPLTVEQLEAIELALKMLQFAESGEA